MLYIMRHGQTDWNLHRKLQGQTDIPLNDTGRNQADAAREEVRNVDLDICFCSPLTRARQTAEAVLRGRKIPIVFDGRLKEMFFGTYEGIENSFEIPDCPINEFFWHPETYAKLKKGEAPGGAESLGELFERTGQFLREAVQPRLEKGENVLIVGHGAMNSSIISQVLHLRAEEFWSRGIPSCRLMPLEMKK